MAPFVQLGRFEKNRIYQMKKAKYAFIACFFDMVANCLELYFGLYPFLWSISCKLSRNVKVASTFFLPMLKFYTILRCLPLVVYYDWIETHHKPVPEKVCGTIVKHVADIVTILLISAALGYSFADLVGPYLCVTIPFAFLLGLILFTSCIALILIPLVGKRLEKILQEGAVRTEVERVTSLVGFPLKNVYVFEGMNEANAFYMGSACTKRVVIYDTVLQKQSQNETETSVTEKELAAVVAHELGHWKYNHIIIRYIFMTIIVSITFALLEVMLPIGLIYEAVRFDDSVQPVIVGYVILLRFVLIPYKFIVFCGVLIPFRYMERQADRFAQSLGYAKPLCTALVKIYERSHGYPIEDKVFSVFVFTHPRLTERLKTLSKS